MAQIHHPNVLEVFDFGKEAGRYFIVMEYLQGHSLARLIMRAHDRGALIDPLLVAFIGAAAARGLHAAHTARGRDGEALGVVHRDISPQNIFLTYAGVTKVIDFGIARADKRLARTSAGVLKGKAAYMSPEQIREEPLGGRSDVFALGVCLWEAITGRRLFFGADQFDTMQAVLQAKIEPPTALIGRTDAFLDELILGALSRDLQFRPPTAATFEAGLTDHIRSARKIAERDVADLLRILFPEEFAQEVALLRDLEQKNRTVTAEHRLRAMSVKPAGLEEAPTFAGDPSDLDAMERLNEHVHRAIASLSQELAPLEVRQAQEKEAAEVVSKVAPPARRPIDAQVIVGLGVIAVVVLFLTIAAILALR